MPLGTGTAGGRKKNGMRGEKISVCASEATSEPRMPDGFVMCQPIVSMRRCAFVCAVFVSVESHQPLILKGIIGGS